MRLLFVPCSRGVLSHLIPLRALCARLDGNRHETAFLLPERYHRAFRDKAFEVIDLDYTREGAFRAEMLVFGRFRPDVVVDDLSETVLLSAAAMQISRVTVKRTGTFPGGVPRNANHHHSMLPPDSEPDSFAQFYRDSEAVFGVPSPRDLVEVSAADMNIIPGIGEIEVLPESLINDPNYTFAGALVISDAEAALTHGSNHDIDPLLAFFERNHDRRIVYVTLGNIVQASDAIREMIRHLLAEGCAVVSSVALADMEDAGKEKFHYSPFLPMHTVCANAHLMIHHCGSGTYQYQIIHTLPAICIGSQCYDRDDVAMRLEELGVAKYLPSPNEMSDFVACFRRMVQECLNPEGAWYLTALGNLRTLKESTERVMTEFDFEAVLQRAVS